MILKGKILKILPAVVQLLCLCSAHGQSMDLLTQDGFTISYAASKTVSSKKTDSYSITITVQTPAADSYFTVHKAGNPLSDLNIDRYAKIEVVNHAGIFKSGERHLTGEPANLIATDNTVAYMIRRGPHTESFTIDVPPGKVPELRASLTATILPFEKISFIKASDAELFAGTRPNGRVFVVYRDIDTLREYRSDMLRFMDHNQRPTQATYLNKQFIVRINDSPQDDIITAIPYVDWNNVKLFARINGENFDTSVKEDFANTITAQQIRLKDQDGNNKIVRLEDLPRNILPFNTRVPVSQSFSSPNGTYVLRLVNGALELHNTSSNQVIWNSMAFGAAKNGMTLTQINSEFELRMAAMLGQTGKFGDLGSFLSVGDNGNLLIYRPDGFAVWQSNTTGR